MLPATEVRPVSRGALRSAAGAIIFGSFFIILAARLFRLTSRYSVNIFFWDQWGFNNATLFQKHSLWQMFRWQYGPHRLGLGPLLSKLIEPYFHWNSRAESFVACSVVVLAAGFALWLKKRLFGEISIWDAAIPCGQGFLQVHPLGLGHVGLWLSRIHPCAELMRFQAHVSLAVSNIA